MEELLSAYKEVGPKRYRETTAVVQVMLVGLYALPSAPLARRQGLLPRLLEDAF